MPADPKRLQSIFLAAVETDDRTALLERECGGDADLLRHVEKLLAAHDDSAELPVAVAPTGDYASVAIEKLAPGSLFAGRYKLREQLGEGGMGVVYVADQLEPVQRRVALKIIRANLPTEALLARFEQERQALALMDHPNIAKVFDAGVDDGTPYFVMELIKGLPITKYCDDAKLTPKQRLELFIPVCQAVQHAHQKGIIHRDLKPANIIVGLYDGKPVSKVIDFGVAKMTGPRLTEHSVYTEVGSIIGTLEYMSPEQAELNNLDIDTRTDIYALGVILYELLTGAVPFSRKEMQSAGFAEMLRIIKEIEPSKPSTKLSGSGSLPSVAACRHTEPAKLTRLVRGELDWITMKALEKDRTRRYETANGMAMDIQRYLDDEPVLASPPSAAYRLRKFAKKNLAALSTAAALALLLIAGITVSAWQAVRATQAETAAKLERDEKERARRDEAAHRLRAEEQSQRADKERATATAISSFLQNDLLSQVAPIAQLEARGKVDSDLKLREVLDRAAQRLDDRFATQPEIEGQLRHTIGRTFKQLGLYDVAEKHFRRALELFENHLGKDAETTVDARLDVAVVLIEKRQPADAEKLLVDCVECFERNLGANHNKTITSLANLGTAYLYQGKMEDAEKVLTVAMERGKNLSSPKARETVLDVMNTLALTYRDRGQNDRALELFQKVLAEARNVFGPKHPDVCSIANNLATTLNNLGRPVEAIVLFDEYIAIQREIEGPEHPSTLWMMYRAAECYMNAGNFEKGREFFQTAFDGQSKVLGPSATNTIRTSTELFKASLISAGVADAIQHAKKHVDLIKRADGPTAESVGYASAGFGYFLLRNGFSTEAVPFLTEALTIRREKKPDDVATFNTQSMLGAAFLGQKRYAEAEPLLLQGYEGMKQREEKIPKDAQVRLREAIERLLQLYEVMDKKDEAAKWQKELDVFKAAQKPESKP